MSEVPVEELLECIQKHLDARAGATPKVGTVRRGGFFSLAVYDQLEEAGAVTSSIYVKPFLTPPHVPVIGGLWQRMRSAAHELVVFYVNRLAGAQAAFNRQVVACLDALVEDLDSGGRANLQSEVVALREEVKSLRARLDALEAATWNDRK